MHPFYEKKNSSIAVFTMQNQHYPPHLHPFLECVYVQSGTLVIGQGPELFSMESGDFALLFPNTIHHYQVFSETRSKSVYLMASTEELGIFANMISSYIPVTPVIPASRLDPEIRHCLRSMQTLKESSYKKELLHSYLQIILARCVPQLELRDRQLVHSNDIVYEVISYITTHFQEEISLSGMASELGVSQYVLSRVFSGTFHTNFNTYLNEVRLKHACNLLKYSSLPITEIAMESGFASLRTFNRFCREKLRMTPREFRTQYQQSLTETEDEQR